ncbi:MAG: hypothetical protein H7641_01675 [Candidatus Heimdallarchaeota archaeon]|nr:hypothetical protein [Candidatus Heimdallarchaeota archaeon]MCK4876272.1 hypothetical protein [Candidatus Heimdallarchaeota archaeon]
MSKIAKRRFLFVLSVFILILSPSQTQAAKMSRIVKDENGMKIKITCETNTSFVSERFRINLTLELTRQPDTVVKLYKVIVKLRVLVNQTELRSNKTIEFDDVNQDTPQRKSPSIEYRNTWGKVKLQLQLRFFLDQTEPLPSFQMRTEWLDFLTFKSKGSFATDFDWAFIILGVGAVIGVGLVLYKKYL